MAKFGAGKPASKPKAIDIVIEAPKSKPMPKSAKSAPPMKGKKGW